MAIGPDMKIWYALKEGLRQVLTSVGEGLPVEWPNDSLNAPPGGYLRVRHVPNTPLRPFLGSLAPHERLGIVQVMVNSRRGTSTSVAGVDNTARAMRIADKIASALPPDYRMPYEDVVVRVRQSPRVGEVVNPSDSAYTECAVEIQYRCFA